jgi:NADH:ubiquinone oxidoreductase subunit 4 (subunit M)
VITTITIVIPLLGAILVLLLPADARFGRYAAAGFAAA